MLQIDTEKFNKWSGSVSTLLPLSGEFEAAIEEHRQELALSEVLQDVIGSAVANRKIGECFAELGNIEAALKVRSSEFSPIQIINYLVSILNGQMTLLWCVQVAFVRV